MLYKHVFVNNKFKYWYTSTLIVLSFFRLNSVGITFFLCLYLYKTFILIYADGKNK